MEQVLFRAHVRLVNAACRFTTPTSRLIIEKALLLLCVISFVVLALLHWTYASAQSLNCLADAKFISSDDGSLRDLSADVELLRIIVNNDWRSVTTTHARPTISLRTFDDSFPQCGALVRSSIAADASSLLFSSAKTGVSTIDDGSCKQQQQQQQKTWNDDDKVYYFSLDKGYLFLRPEALRKHKTEVLDVVVSGSYACFGPRLFAGLIHNFVGYDTIVKNWAIKYFGKGFLYSTYSKELFDLSVVTDFVVKTGNAGNTGVLLSAASLDGGSNSSTPRSDENSDVDAAIQAATSITSPQHYVAFKVGVLLTTLFLFFMTTTLVSFTLRVTQERMLKFTFLLQHYISHRIPYAGLVGTHLVETLVFVPLMVGILFFMFEFFLDQLLAFMVLTLVWCAEVYSVACSRTRISIRFFPRIFFLYFCLFHIYFFSFPFGFSFVALTATLLFLLHAMVYFLFNYEIPAFDRGEITAHAPRATVPVYGLPAVEPSESAERRSTAEAQATLQSAATAARSAAQARRRELLQRRERLGTSTGGTGLPPIPRPIASAAAAAAGAGARAGASRIRSNSQSSESGSGTGTQVSYSRHVELSRRIQQAQMVAMMGLEAAGRSTNLLGAELHAVGGRSLSYDEADDVGMNID